MKKFLGILVLSLLWSNVGFADHRKFDCSVVIGTPPWEDSLLHDDFMAPWNSFLLDSFLAPWNSIFCSKESVNEYLRDNDVSERYFWKW